MIIKLNRITLSNFFSLILRYKCSFYSHSLSMTRVFFDSSIVQFILQVFSRVILSGSRQSRELYRRIEKNQILWILLSVFPLVAYSPQKAFIKSFVTHYDFSPEGRYTHEYHPFLLNQTRACLQKLEARLVDSKFDVQDRIVIMGYQQEGVPSYYSNMHAKPINDEISLKTKKGRVVPAHNIFGFLTGFLLKDCNWLQQQWFGGKPLTLEHVSADRIDLFDDKAYLFQKHAFGKDFKSILQARKTVEASIKTQSVQNTLRYLVTFWERLYGGELKSFGQEVLATQDILFSVDYAKHLTEVTKIPIKKMYVGPDITYPIEVLPFQEQAVTESAQTFVKQFTATLTPRDNKKTAYIFCSFVDGVGKSTLLGNVINFSRHGEQIDKYERVDNSSSQRGTLFQLESDVFILDLPAQLSHWVSKPDGHVFVDVTSVKELGAQKNELITLVKEQAKTYQDRFDNKLEESLDNPLELYDVYAKNVKLFGSKVRWVPFKHNDQLFIFDKNNQQQIKCLVPLEGVHSRGLKTVYPEHMLFTKGLLLPMQYESFMDDVVLKCKQAGIEKLVFVDFLSMYPRSSRENVRINFLMQQLRELFPEGFFVDKSLYKSLINRGPELFQLLSESQEQVSDALYCETVIRTALYNLFKEHSAHDIVTLSQKQITAQLLQEIKNVQQEYDSYLHEITHKKVEQEFEAVKKYARDKNYETFVRFSFKPLLVFSKFVNELFEHDIENALIHDLWKDVGEQQSMKQLYSFEPASKESIKLTPFFKALRSQWYAALSNLLHVNECRGNLFTLPKIKYSVLPVTLVERNDKVVCLQKTGTATEEKPRFLPRELQTFNNYVRVKNVDWISFGGASHCTQWHTAETYWGMYAFGCDYNQSGLLRKYLMQYKKESYADGFDNVALTSSQAFKFIEEHNGWEQVSQKTYGVRSTKVVKRNSGQWQAVRLWVRAIATLEMLVKDSDVWIMTRAGHKQDFAATLQLLERITLPKYFGIELKEPLFEDYSLVQPVISWNDIQ